MSSDGLPFTLRICGGLKNELTISDFQTRTDGVISLEKLRADIAKYSDMLCLNPKVFEKGHEVWGEIIRNPLRIFLIFPFLWYIILLVWTKLFKKD